MKRSLTGIGAIVAAALLCLSTDGDVSAQHPSAESRSAPPAAQDASRAVIAETARSNRDDSIEEEITVRGRRPLAAYRVELQAAHERVIAIFNEINSSDEFDIVCRNERRTGSRARARVCRARFEGTVSAAAGREYVAGILSFCPGGVTQECIFSEGAQAGMARAQSVEGEAHYKQLLLVEEMQRLAFEDPRLMEAMLEHEQRRLEYLEARGR